MLGHHHYLILSVVVVVVLVSSCEGLSPPFYSRKASSAPSSSSQLRAETAAGASNEYEEDFDAYATDLDPNEARSQVNKENNEYAIVDRTSLWMRTARAPFRIVKKILPKNKAKPGKLILLRCGESTWNANQTFTGWCDPDLTERGVQESEHAARLLLSEGYQPDIVYTSRLKRSIRSTWTVLEELNSLYLPVYKSWRLNERS